MPANQESHWWTKGLSICPRVYRHLGHQTGVTAICLSERRSWSTESQDGVGLGAMPGPSHQQRFTWCVDGSRRTSAFGPHSVAGRSVQGLKALGMMARGWTQFSLKTPFYGVQSKQTCLARLRSHQGYLVSPDKRVQAAMTVMRLEAMAATTLSKLSCRNTPGLLPFCRREARRPIAVYLF